MIPQNSLITLHLQLKSLLFRPFQLITIQASRQCHSHRNRVNIEPLQTSALETPCHVTDTDMDQYTTDNKLQPIKTRVAITIEGEHCWKERWRNIFKQSTNLRTQSSHDILVIHATLHSTSQMDCASSHTNRLH